VCRGEVSRCKKCRCKSARARARVARKKEFGGVRNINKRSVNCESVRNIINHDHYCPKNSTSIIRVIAYNSCPIINTRAYRSTKYQNWWSETTIK